MFLLISLLNETYNFCVVEPLCCTLSGVCTILCIPVIYLHYDYDNDYPYLWMDVVESTVILVMVSSKLCMHIDSGKKGVCAWNSSCGS